MSLDAFDIASAWESVLATTNSTPCNPSAIMLLTAFPPPPPTPTMVILGLISEMPGRILVLITALRQRAPAHGEQTLDLATALADPAASRINPSPLGAHRIRV